jgi:hypothetical protein
VSAHVPSTAIVQASTDKTIPKKHQGKIEPNYYCRGWNSKRKKYCGSRAGLRTAHPGVGRCHLHGGQKADGDARVTHGRKSTIQGERIKALIETHLKDPQLHDVSMTLATAKALMDDFIERYYELTPALMAWYASSEPISEDERLALLRCLDELEALYGEKEITGRQTEALATARAATSRLAEPRPEKPHKVLDIADAVGHADVISKIIHRVNMANAGNAISYARLAAFMFNLRNELDGLIPDREHLRRVVARVMQIRI